MAEALLVKTHSILDLDQKKAKLSRMWREHLSIF